MGWIADILGIGIGFLDSRNDPDNTNSWYRDLMEQVRRGLQNHNAREQTLQNNPFAQLGTTPDGVPTGTVELNWGKIALFGGAFLLLLVLILKGSKS